MGAKMVPFGGWDMPVQYSGVIAEHSATRTAAGIFDVSHMGEIFIEGQKDEILDFLEPLTCNKIEGMKNGQVQYNAVLNEAGGLVDDITVYKFSDKKFMICSNASNYEKVYEHLLKYNKTLNVRNESSKWHQIALQGPKANEILEAYLGKDLKQILYYHFEEINFSSENLIISRTGYTGEDGFEIYSSIPTGLKLWNDLLETGKPFGLLPVGLGARDTLRLEAKYPLYGHELNETRTPVESGNGWIVKEKERKYFQYDKIIQQKKNGSENNITGLKLVEQGVLRENYPVFDKNGSQIGITTSGTYSPTLKESIALAYIQTKTIRDGGEILVEIRGAKKKGIVFTGKFIEGSIRKKG